MRTLRIINSTQPFTVIPFTAILAAALLAACAPDSLPPPARESIGDPEPITTAEIIPETDESPTPTPTATPTPSPEPADEPESTARVLRTTPTHRDGTTAHFEFAEPRLLRFESTKLTLTCDGTICLAVFPDMRAYAILDAPAQYTIETLTDLSPVLEPIFAHHSGLAIPSSTGEAPSPWAATAEPIDPARFSTDPPRFHRDITGQVARPVGDYAANRLIGQPAPYFETTMLDGSNVTIADFEGQAILVDFWATWCPPCIESMPKLDALDQRFGNDGLVVIGMNMDEGPEATRAARQFVSGHGFGFRQAIGADTAPDYRVQVLPTLFLIDREHIIRNVYIGLPPEEDALRREVEQLMR